MSPPKETEVEKAEKGHPWFAALYDTLSRATERRLLAKLRARLLENLQGKVLEIGFGTGANLPYYPAGAAVVATEPDPFMLRRARKKLNEAGGLDVELRQAAAERLPFENGSFDHVVSTLVLCTVGDPERALSEMKRVLRMGGRLHFIEHVRAQGWLGRLQDLLRPVWRFFAGGCTINRRTGELISAAGFQMESLDTETIKLAIPILVGTARVAKE